MIDILLSRLERVEDKGHSRFVALCPAHEDKNPSLALCELSDGRILLHCFAGCEPITVLNAVGLNLSDLFPNGCLGQFKSFTALKNEMVKRETGLSHEEMILEMAKAQRAAKQRLNPADLERERQAYLRVRHAKSHR